MVDGAALVEGAAALGGAVGILVLILVVTQMTTAELILITVLGLLS